MKIQDGRLVPDVVLHGGKIITMNPAVPLAEAVAIADDRIAAVGPDQEIKPLAGTATRRIDLRGACVIPA